MLEVLFTIISGVRAINTISNIEEIRETKKKKEKEYDKLSEKEQHKVTMRKFNLGMSR